MDLATGVVACSGNDIQDNLQPLGVARQLGLRELHILLGNETLRPLAAQGKFRA